MMNHILLLCYYVYNKETVKEHSLGTVGCAAVVDDSCVGTAGRVEHEPVHKVLVREICPQDS
jgi:hypothetical protein